MPTSPSYNLHKIIGFLEKPEVRLDDEKKAAEYHVDLPTLGILYAHAVDSAPRSYSPALMLQKIHLPNRDVSDTLKKRFQTWTRNRMWERVGDLVLRKNTAMELAESCLPALEFTAYPEGSLEKKVLNLSEKGEFELIGQQLKEGAKAYDDYVKERRMDNYRIAQEYVELLEAFNK